MLEAAGLPNGPRADTFLDVRRQLPKIMPKLHDRLGCLLPETIVDGALIWGALNQLSDEFRALPMVFWTVGFLLHLDAPS
jgi:Na+-transporting NADH:ubiquinone oxidoreductase subunit NqrE